MPERFSTSTGSRYRRDRRVFMRPDSTDTPAPPTPSGRPRIGHINFLNCFPLLWGLAESGSLLNLQLTEDTPDHLSDALVSGALDIGPISTVELLRNPDDLLVLPDIAIGSNGPVMSCLIVSRLPLDQLDNLPVALGSASRTAVRLAELLLNEMVGVQPEYFFCRPDFTAMLREAPAAVLIGDAALRAALYEAPRLNLQVHDLGQMWRDWTGLPFVFAAFAARREFAEREPEVVSCFHAGLLLARDLFLANVDEVCVQAARRGLFEPAFLRRYYTTALDFRLEPQHFAGIAAFARKIGGDSVVFPRMHGRGCFGLPPDEIVE